MHDELDLLDNGTDTTYKGKRPAFLQVLCILTFVGAGLGLIYSFFSIVAMSALEGVTSALSDLSQDNDAAAPLENMYRWAKWAIYAGIFGNLACLAGAIVMWGMRKIGFIIYVIGQAVPLIVSVLSYLATYGGDNGLGLGMMGGFGLAGLIIGMVFPIGFIVMYGLNYKFLK